MDLEKPYRDIRFVVYDSATNQFMGECVIKTEDIERHPSKTINEWFPLKNRNESVQGEDIGDIRLSFHWQRAIVLQDNAYDDLLSVLMKDKLSLVKKLSEVSHKIEKQVAECLVKAFETKKSAVHLIKELCFFEIENTQDPSLFFRANTVPTKSFDMYMRLNGGEYLKQALLDIIRQIQAASAKKKGSLCEMDTYRLENIKPEKRDKQLQKNLKNLKQYVDQILASIKDVTARFCPHHFRNIFDFIKIKIDSKFNDQLARHRAVGGFIFLRFFLPSFNIPKKL